MAARPRFPGRPGSRFDRARVLTTATTSVDDLPASPDEPTPAAADKGFSAFHQLLANAALLDVVSI